MTEELRGLIELVGFSGALIFIVVISSVLMARIIVSSRAKMTEALAAKEVADAATASGMTTLALQLYQQNTSILAQMADESKRHNDLLAQMADSQSALTAAQEQIGMTFAERGRVIIEHMGLNNEALATVISMATTAQASAALAAETSALTHEAIEGVTTSGSSILAGVNTLIEQFRLLSVAIQEKGDVDDELRAKILKQMAELNAYLSRKEIKEGSEPNEQINEQTDRQTDETTIKLTGRVTGVLNTGDNGDGSAG